MPKEFYRSLINNSFEMMFLLNLKGEIVYQSPAVKKLLGYTPEVLSQYDAFYFIHPDDKDAVMEKFQEVLLDPGNKVVVVYRYRHNSGSYLYLQSTGCNLLNDPAIRGIVVSSRDVTELMELENELKDKNDDLTALLYSTYHELRNPLASLHGLIQLQQLVKEDYHPVMMKLVNSMDTSLGKISNIMDIMNNEVRCNRFFPKEYIYRSLEEYGNSDYELTFIEGGVTEVVTDKKIFAYVVDSLIENAFHFQNIHRKLKLIIRLRKEGNYLKLDIADNGIGIVPEAQPYIFQMFYRGSVESKGIGLGLFLVDRAMKKIKGGISFVSSSHRGTIFKVMIPLQEDH